MLMLSLRSLHPLTLFFCLLFLLLSSLCFSLLFVLALTCDEWKVIHYVGRHNNAFAVASLQPSFPPRPISPSPR